MSKKRIKAVIVAMLLALAVSISSPLSAVPSVVQAAECETTAGGCR